MRYLGLDLGTKTLGISLSDKSGIIASSYKTIHFNEEDYNSVLDELKGIIDEFEIKTVVLGLPKNMNNTLGDAHNIMLQGDLSRKKRKKHVDSLAANIILQRYLDSRKG